MNKKQFTKRNINESLKTNKNDSYDDGSEAISSQDSLQKSKEHLENWCEEQIKRYSGNTWGNYGTENVIKPVLLNYVRSAQHKDIRTKDNAMNYAWRVAMAKFAMRLANRYGIDLDNEWNLVNEELKNNINISKKQKIRLNESQFKNLVKKVVKESVKKVMNEQYTQGDINNAFQQWQQQGLHQIRNGQQGQQTPVQSMGNENAIYKSSALMSKAKYLYQYLMNNDIKSASQMLQPISDLLEGIEQDILSHQKDTQYRNSMQK